MTEIADISVVIPAYGPTPHLEGLIKTVLSGTVLPKEIIVSHSGPDDPSEWLNGKFPEVTALHSEERLFAGAARNRGAVQANGSILAFCDSDVLPQPNWLEEIGKALLAKDNRFVVGSVGMARTGGYWGTANWLCEFSELGPWRKSRVQTGGASCNLAVRRADFEAVGRFDETMTPGEDTILFHSLREAKLEQYFWPKANVGHYNHTGFKAFSHHQRRLGEQFSKVRKVHKLQGNSVTSYPILATVIWLPKLALVLKRMAEGGVKEWLRILVHGPGILIGSWILAWGIFRGNR